MSAASIASMIAGSVMSSPNVTTPAPILDRAPGRPSLLAVERVSMTACDGLDKAVVPIGRATFDVTGGAVVHRMSTTPGSPAGLADRSSAVRSPGRMIIDRATYARL